MLTALFIAAVTIPWSPSSISWFTIGGGLIHVKGEVKQTFFVGIVASFVECGEHYTWTFYLRFMLTVRFTVVISITLRVKSWDLVRVDKYTEFNVGRHHIRQNNLDPNNPILHSNTPHRTLHIVTLSLSMGTSYCARYCSARCAIFWGERWWWVVVVVVVDDRVIGEQVGKDGGESDLNRVCGGGCEEWLLLLLSPTHAYPHTEYKAEMSRTCGAKWTKCGRLWARDNA